MTIGISKELLTELHHVAKVLGNPIRAQVLSDLLNNCKELDPWLPIDENTPKNGEEILLCSMCRSRW